MLCALTGTLVFWSDADQRATVGARRELEQRAMECANRLRLRFADCEQILRMGRVLVEYSDSVSRTEWARFVESLDLGRECPGVNGLAFVSAVPDDQLAEYLEEARRDVDPGFTRHVRAGVDDAAYLPMHYIIRYHEPSARNGPLWGLDIAADEENRRPYDMSMATGMMRMSGTIALAQQGSEGEALHGIVMAAPIYQGATTPDAAELRADEIEGWVALSIDVDRMMSTWWRDCGLDGGYRILDRCAAEGLLVVHHSGVELEGSAGPTVLRMPMAMGGLHWEIEMFRTGALAVDHSEANLTAFIGLVISLLIGGIMWSMAYTRSRALQLARRMTAHLQESEAQQRRLAEEAEQANRMKSLFLANMSHDVRTPMTAIIGYTKLVEQELGDVLSPLGLEAMVAIRRSGDHLLGLINDVLDLSKIEAARLQLVNHPIEMDELIVACVEIVRQPADAKGIELRVALRSAIPARISGDSVRIRQVLLNLLGNAVKFTEQGHVAFTIWAAEHGADLLCFEVTDTGIGMTEAEVGRVFEPFVQADASHTRTHGGTGLGLTIAQRLVEQMGGAIEVESRFGVGSRFIVRMPVERLGEQTLDGLNYRAASGKPALVADTCPVPGLAGGRVLVAEDGPDNQRLIRHILGRAGYDVDIAGTGRAAVEAVKQADATGAPFGAVLLDMQLPELDGYAVATLLRREGHTSPLIAITAHSMVGDREKCLAAGCDDYLSKPFDPDDLVAVVSRAFERAAAA
ncbi:MAG: CHASE domain-containing protein [Phycisphaeraceae bacterium]|nr:MAG: CHASE domain-containing protein [Phycisphaeraceae bacterium]